MSGIVDNTKTLEKSEAPETETTQANITAMSACSDGSLNASPDAIEKVLVLSKVYNKQPRFRIKVTHGGCSGLSYDMGLDEETEEQDMVFEQSKEVCLVTDTYSMSYIKGATLIVVEGIDGWNLRLSNPQARGGCGCGRSFSV